MSKIGIVVSRFNKPITDKLLKGALQALEENNITEDNVNVLYAPGAYEIPLVLKKSAIFLGIFLFGMSLSAQYCKKT